MVFRLFLTRLALCLISVHATAQTKVPDTHEQERKAYDEIYSSKREVFSAEPNAFLVRMITGRKPGRALDVAMGQGRNALWLASQGWTVTGFDISAVAIDEARKAASKRGFDIETVVTPYERFDWGTQKWDLIVFSYYFPQDALPKVWEALKPGGLILVEGFHIDTARVRPLGGGYHNNELFSVLNQYRILIYEDLKDRQDWGPPYGDTNRLVRVLAQKSVPLPPGCSWEGRSYKAGESMCWGVAGWACGAEGWAYGGKCAGSP